MPARRPLLAACLLALLPVGCVDRRFVVTTNAPGAHVSVDGDPVGATPADGTYVYTGQKEFRAVAAGYEPLRQLVKFEPSWYDYPGLDLFAEVLWPFRIEDVKRVHLELIPTVPVSPQQVQAAAESLRVRGMALPPPTVPNEQPDVPPRDDPYARLGPLPHTGSTTIPVFTPGRVNTYR